ncbi:MAG: metallophosphoesterase, partial [Nevskiales bacterium]
DYHYSGKSTKWNMPARYYHFIWPLDNDKPIAEFFALDSNPLTAILPDPSPEFNFVTYGAAQQAWFSDALKKSRATWKIAFAHHPYLSNGIHGNAGNYDRIPDILPILTANGRPWLDLLNATLCAEGVDIYFQGHDHDLQWLKPVERCGKTQFIVSGAGELPRPFADATRNDSYWQQDQSLGFFWFRLKQDQLIGAAYTLDENLQPQLQFEQSLPRR